MAIEKGHVPTVEEFEQYKTRFRNWGRWGDDDQLGTLNFITDQTRRDATSLVKLGRTISLSYPLDTTPGVRNSRPAEHYMQKHDTGSMDYIGIAFHGLVTTHIDALCHIFAEDGQLYGGRSNEAIGFDGASTNSIDYWRDGIVTRGVLYDIPRLRGTKYVTGDSPVHSWDLEEAAEKQHVEPRSGDAVLIRSNATDFWHDFPAEADKPSWRPGVHASCLEFLYEHEASLLGWDQLDASDQGYPGVYISRSPIHALAIPYMGLPLLDNVNLEPLAALCAELNQWEFELVIAPLVVKGGTGSPANPIAIF